MSDTATFGYEQVIGFAAQSLAPDEFWCVASPTEGVLYGTMSKRVDTAIVTFCDALDCDWGDATDEGFKLVKARKPAAEEAGR